MLFASALSFGTIRPPLLGLGTLEPSALRRWLTARCARRSWRCRSWRRPAFRPWRRSSARQQQHFARAVGSRGSRLYRRLHPVAEPVDRRGPPTERIILSNRSALLPSPSRVHSELAAGRSSRSAPGSSISPARWSVPRGCYLLGFAASRARRGAGDGGADPRPGMTIPPQTAACRRADDLPRTALGISGPAR